MKRIPDATLIIWAAEERTGLSVLSRSQKAKHRKQHRARGAKAPPVEILIRNVQRAIEAET